MRLKVRTYLDGAHPFCHAMFLALAVHYSWSAPVAD